MTDKSTEALAERECEICGARVPVAVYREHLLKACPGSDSDSELDSRAT